MSADPIPCLLAGIRGNEILTANNGSGGTSGTLRVTVNGNTQTIPFPASPATLTASRYYYIAGDDQVDATGPGEVNGTGDLLKLLKDALDAHPEGATFTVAVTEAGLVTISCTQQFQILATSGDNHFDMTLLGFDNAQSWPASPDDSLGTTTKHRFGWWPDHYQAFDSGDKPQVRGGIARPLAGGARAVVSTVGGYRRVLRWENQDRGIVRTHLVGSAGQPFEELWFTDGLYDGRPWRFYQDRSSKTSSSYSVYVLGAFPDGEPYAEANDDPWGWDVEIVGERLQAAA